ncbi:MAG TPA: hypothetical protein VGM51_04325 [Armatimonadota bacterium]|jgi:hypothetical protein
MNTESLTGEEIRTIGLNALMGALGPSGFIRFLQQFSNGSGDYTRDRQALLGNPTVDELVRETKALQAQEGEPGHTGDRDPGESGRLSGA